MALQRHKPRKEDTRAAGRGNGGLTTKERKQGYQPGVTKKEGIRGLRRRSEVIVIILSEKVMRSGCG